MKILKRVEISKKFTLINLIILIISTPILLITIHFLQNNQQNLTSSVPKNTQTNFLIYNDALANSWHNGSSTDSIINLSATAQAYSGSCAISFTANKAFAGMY